MRRKLLFILMSILTVLGSIIAVGTPAYADTLYYWGNICHNTTDQCMNEQGGIKGNGVQFWSHTTEGEPDNDWNFWQVAGNPTVNCATGFPWGGTGNVSTAQCNAWGLNGDVVLKIAWAPNGNGSGYCIWTGPYDNTDDDPVGTYTCSPSGEAWNTETFVLTKYGFLINSFATALQLAPGGNGERVYLGTCDFTNNGDANGDAVCLTYNHGIAWSFLSPP